MRQMLPRSQACRVGFALSQLSANGLQFWSSGAQKRFGSNRQTCHATPGDRNCRLTTEHRSATTCQYHAAGGWGCVMQPEAGVVSCSRRPGNALEPQNRGTRHSGHFFPSKSGGALQSLAALTAAGCASIIQPRCTESSYDKSSEKHSCPILPPQLAVFYPTFRTLKDDSVNSGGDSCLKR